MLKRAKERIPVGFDCTLRLGDHQKSCTVKNISKDGVLTCWKPQEFLDLPFRIGDVCSLEIRFSDHRIFGPKVLHCAGKIVRVAIDNRLVAFQISKARFRSLISQSSAPRDPAAPYLM